MLLPIFILGGAIGFFLLYPGALNEKNSVTPSNKVPTVFDHLFVKYGTEYGLDWKMLKRISWIESNLGQEKSVARGIKLPRDIAGSVSSDGLSWGIMQVTLSTAKGYDPLATQEKLNDPDYSVKIAAKHFYFLKRVYPTFKERDLVMSYNHGQGNQLRFIEKEKNGTLLETEFLAGRAYWKKYLKAKELI